MASKETFLENLRSQYKDDIEMIITECQHHGKTYVDVDKLNLKLKSLHGFAFIDGLTEEDWLEIIYEVSPEIYDCLDFGIIAA